MPAHVALSPIGPEIWYLPYPLRVLGVDIGRRVTVIRLPAGDLLIHSTAPFSDAEQEAVRQLGRPRWIIDAMLDHDTFSQEGAEAFREAEYRVPAGFPSQEVKSKLLMPAPAEWAGQVELAAIEGAPSFGEVAMFHVPSRTLIVCDLIMNFPHPGSWWEKLLLGAGIGRHRSPGTSRRFKSAIRDPEAFRQSIRRVMEWDFETVVVGHGEPIRSDAKSRTREAFQRAGWLE